MKCLGVQHVTIDSAMNLLVRWCINFNVGIDHLKVLLDCSFGLTRFKMMPESLHF